MDTINISFADFKQLKKLYKHAVYNKFDKFIFKDREVLTAYAKYMIEYLEPKFKDIR